MDQWVDIMNGQHAKSVEAKDILTNMKSGDNYRWHSNNELPDENKRIYILLYIHRRWIIDYGYFTPEVTFGKLTFPAYVEEYDNKNYWENVKKWCYDFEFHHLIQKSFDKRIRKHFHRHERKNKRLLSE
jgi:hypothetical protein